jgi:hypothetical protein
MMHAPNTTPKGIDLGRCSAPADQVKNLAVITGVNSPPKQVIPQYRSAELLAMVAGIHANMQRMNEEMVRANRQAAGVAI